MKRANKEKERKKSRTEWLIRSSEIITPIDSKTLTSYSIFDDGLNRRGSGKESKRDPESPVYREFTAANGRLKAEHLPVWFLQSDVEKYIGGSDGDVEGAMRNFQDALAYVEFLHSCYLLSR